MAGSFPGPLQWSTASTRERQLRFRRFIRPPSLFRFVEVTGLCKIVAHSNAHRLLWAKHGVIGN
jgi:hypothetical protein